MKQKRRLKATCAFIITALFLTFVVPNVAAQSDRTRRIRFARGRSTAVLKDAVVRGTIDHYLLRASAGQTMTVRITSLEDNAVFEVFAPGSGRSISGNGTEWSGELPSSGDYVIDVSGTRGNASYTLQVTVK
jgi:hypothetical protein